MSKYFKLRKVGPNEPEDKEFARIYPEIVKHGTLGKAIEAELQSRGLSLPVQGFEKIGFPVHGATVHASHRSCQIMIAANERCLFADFRERGILLIKLQTQSIAVLAVAISGWCAKQKTIRDMQSISPEVVVQEVADAYEAGPQTMVQRQWSFILKRGAEGHRELLPVLEEAFKTPELSCLFPFTSLIHLCFSRCTGHPFTRDCPHVTPLSSGRFRVSGIKEKIIGEGNAQEAIAMVVRNLPAGCSAAVHGTEEDLQVKG